MMGPLMDKPIRPIIAFTVNCEAASKANSRTIQARDTTKRPRSIKSRKANSFLTAFLWQAVRRPAPYEGKVFLRAHLVYATERPDLDESLVMDGLEHAKIIKNDRQIRAKFITHGIDRKNPRVEIELYPLEQVEGLLKQLEQIAGLFG